MGDAEDWKLVLGFVLFLTSIILLSRYTGNYLFGFIVFSIVFVIFAVSHFSGAIWFPSDNAVVNKMVDMAGLRDGELAYDLGSGDGRILVEAARRSKKVRLKGVEVNPFVALISRLLIKSAGFGKRIGISVGNLFNADLRGVDVIFVFLMQKANYRLEKKLKKELKKGSRIVSHIWKFKDLRLVRADEKLKVYLYKV
jgi:SAM-dependent methyltransferase